MAGPSRLFGAFYRLLFVAILLFVSQMIGIARAEESRSFA